MEIDCPYCGDALTPAGSEHVCKETYLDRLIVSNRENKELQERFKIAVELNAALDDYSQHTTDEVLRSGQINMMVGGPGSVGFGSYRRLWTPSVWRSSRSTRSSQRLKEARKAFQKMIDQVNKVEGKNGQ